MKVTYKKALKALEQVVEGKEDYVYNPGGQDRCWYAPQDGKPTGCLVGEALKVLGLLTPEVSESIVSFKGLIGIGIPGHGLESIEGWPSDLDWTEPAIVLLSHAQNSQDGGSTWGEAVKNGKASAKAFKRLPKEKRADFF